MVAKKKPKHGGAREGAGRKATDGAVGPFTRHTVMLDAVSPPILEALGLGDISAGVRIAAKMAGAKT